MLPQNVNNSAASFASGDTTTLKTVFTAGSNDSDLLGLLATSNDTSAINLQIWLRTTATDYLIGTVNIPVAAGSNGTANAIDLLNTAALPGLPVNAVGKRYIPLKNGDSIKVGCLVTMTAAKTLYVVSIGQDY